MTQEQIKALIANLQSQLVDTPNEEVVETITEETVESSNEETAENEALGAELADAANREPQTNGTPLPDGAILPVPGVEVALEVPTTLVEPVGTLAVSTQSIDERFATIMNELAELRARQDKINALFTAIDNRIGLVENVAENITTLDNDLLLTSAINHLL
jgi:division protein CdvB (Snf7/Vps24/ESCRT-III family)